MSNARAARDFFVESGFYWECVAFDTLTARHFCGKLAEDFDPFQSAVHSFFSLTRKQTLSNGSASDLRRDNRDSGDRPR